MVSLVFHLDSCPLTDVAAGAAADLDCTVLGFAAVSGANADAYAVARVFDELVAADSGIAVAVVVAAAG